MLKAVTLILITIYTGGSGKPSETVTETFYGDTHVDAALACREYAKRHVHISKQELRDGVFARGFTCQYNRGN